MFGIKMSDIYIFAAIVGVVGWAVIEFLLWVGHHVHTQWG